MKTKITISSWTIIKIIVVGTSAKIIYDAILEVALPYVTAANRVVQKKVSEMDVQDNVSA